MLHIYKCIYRKPSSELTDKSQIKPRSTFVIEAIRLEWKEVLALTVSQYNTAKNIDAFAVYGRTCTTPEEDKIKFILLHILIGLPCPCAHSYMNILYVHTIH